MPKFLAIDSTYINLGLVRQFNTYEPTSGFTKPWGIRFIFSNDAVLNVDFHDKKQRDDTVYNILNGENDDK